MRALIVGGGVAGPAAALALQAVGIDSVVLEARRPEELAQGSYLTLAPNGVHALGELGLLEPARGIGFPSRTNRMVGANGRVLGTITLGRPLPDGTPALTCRRADLAALLADEAARRGAEVRYGARVVGVEEHPERVEVVLEDGSRVAGDLLVGADGVRSRTRRIIDPAAPDGRYVGLTNFGGITRGTPLAADLAPEAWHFVFGRRAFFGAHPTPDGDVVWFVNAPRAPIDADERARTSPAQWQAWLVGLLADDVGPAAALVAAGELELSGDSTYDLGHVPVWHRGRLLVIGDAAHAPSPSSGQGASMALEDAVELARCLRDLPSVEEAFAAYDAVRRGRVEKVVAAGARSSSSKTPGPVGRLVRDAMLRLVFRHVVTDESVAWMSDHRVRLAEPVTTRR